MYIDKYLVQVVSRETEIHTGYKLCSIDVDVDWTNIAMNHGKRCTRGKLLVVETTKSGFEMRERY